MATKEELSNAKENSANSTAIEFLRDEMKSTKKWVVANTLATLAALGGQFHTEIAQALVYASNWGPIATITHLFH